MKANARQQVGVFTQAIIDLLDLQIAAGTPIYMSASNVRHMKSSHPQDFKKYGADISHIISNPDYVGLNSKDNSIEFTKEYIINNEFVKVAVRISASNVYYARSLYVLNSNRVKNFIAKGTLKKT